MLESRVDHTRVVLLLRRDGHLPLVKDYLLSVQKTNLAAVNEAVNELLVEEDNFEVTAAPSTKPGTCLGQITMRSCTAPAYSCGRLCGTFDMSPCVCA